MKNLSTHQQRRARSRAKVFGTPERPRLAVHITNRNVTAQIIDDTVGKTLAYVTTVKSTQTGALTAKAEWVGEQIAAAGKKAKVSKVVFDRAGKIYHGRLASLADAARKSGLEL